MSFPARERDMATVFLRWSFLRAVFHRGYVLVSGLYFVVDARLSASQLVILATVLGVTLVASDGPAGVWSDAFSRKWSLVIGHAFLVAGMVLTGLVIAFPLIVVTQVLWGFGWGFSSGADVAWITDELDQSDRIARVLTARARWELAGGASGMVVFGLLGWATSLSTAVLVSGVAMMLPGLYVASRFPERDFARPSEKRWTAWMSIFRRGVVLSRHDREITRMFAATLVINGASTVAWLFPKRLISLGFPNSPVLWYTALGILASVFGALALRVVERRIDGAGVARRAYVLSCLAGVFGLGVLAVAPNAVIACVGVLLVSGVTFNVTRAVSVIWVNRRATRDVRATIHSFLGQSESIGEIFGGILLALIAQRSAIPVVLIVSAAVVLFAGAVVSRSRADPRSVPIAHAGITD